jgi:hypothetical protein
LITEQPASLNLSVLLQAVPRLVFEVMKALSALTVEQAFCELLLELALFSLRQDNLKTLEESL